MQGNIYLAKKSSNESKVSKENRKLSETLYKAKRKNWKELPEDQLWVEGAVFHGKKDCYILTNIKVTDEWENCEIGADVIGYVVDPKTLRQWIGISDKEDKKIFIGHVVEVNESTLDGEVQVSTIKIYPGYKELMRLEYANELKIVGDSFIE